MRLHWRKSTGKLMQQTNVYKADDRDHKNID